MCRLIFANNIGIVAIQIFIAYIKANEEQMENLYRQNECNLFMNIEIFYSIIINKLICNNIPKNQMDNEKRNEN